MNRNVNPLIGAVNQAIRNAQSEARTAYDKVKSLKANRMNLRQFMPIVSHLTRREVDIYGGISTTYIYITLFNLNGFRDERLTKTLDAMLAFTDTIKESESAQWHQKTYEARLGQVEIKVSAYVDEESETCKRVEIGRELVEQVKYKMVCN